MTEHSASVFVFFFLAEYASIVLMCILTSLLFFGGYLLNITYIVEGLKYIDPNLHYRLSQSAYVLSYPTIEGFLHGITLGVKTCVFVFVYIWVRASFPRIRYDQLMSFCWTVLLPLVIGLIVLYPCVLYAFSNGITAFNCNIKLL